MVVVAAGAELDAPAPEPVVIVALGPPMLWVALAILVERLEMRDVVLLATAAELVETTLEALEDGAATEPVYEMDAVFSEKVVVAEPLQMAARAAWAAAT